jgi:hypothetical protein
MDMLLIAVDNNVSHSQKAPQEISKIGLFSTFYQQSWLRYTVLQPYI